MFAVYIKVIDYSQHHIAYDISVMATFDNLAAAEKYCEYMEKTRGTDDSSFFVSDYKVPSAPPHNPAIPIRRK